MAYSDAPQDERAPLLLSIPSYDETTNVDPESCSEQALMIEGQNTVFYLTYVIPMAIGLLFTSMNGTIIAASYASIGSELNQLHSASWIPTAYMLAQTSSQPLAGKLSDIFGRKACLLTCYAIYAFGCLFFGLSTTMTQLILARAISGVGSGGISILVAIIMSDVIPLRLRGTWQGIVNLVYAAGAIIGGPVGGFFADRIGWRWPFILQVPLLAIASFVILLTLHLPATNRSTLSENIRRIDFGGALTLVLAVFFLLFGLDRGGIVSWSDWRTVGSFTAFAIFASLFVFIEVSVASEPFAPKRIVSDSSLLPCYITGFFGAAASQTVMFYIPLFYQAVEGKTASEAGTWLIAGIVGGLIGALLGGIVIQHTGKFYAITVISYFLVFIGTTAVFFSSGIVVVSTIGIAIGMGVTEIGTCSGITTTLVAWTAHAGPEDQATATAVSFLFRSLGSVLALSAGGTFVQITLRYLLNKRLSGDDAQEIVKHVQQSLNYLNKLDPATRATVVQSYEEAMQVTFLFTVALAVLAMLSSLFIREKALTDTRS